MRDQSAEQMLCDEVEIATPGILVGVIDDLKGLIIAGKLKQVGGNVQIDSIPNQPPFNEDSIYMTFESVPGGTKYFLSCETYHGMGGIFGRGTMEEWRAAFLDRRINK